jgi:hypothetical protein
MTDPERGAVRAYNDVLATGGTRAWAFEEALILWRLIYPQHSELRAVADLASALRAAIPAY